MKKSFADIYRSFTGATKNPKKFNAQKVTSMLMAFGMMIYHYHWIKYGDINQITTLLYLDLTYLGFLIGTNVMDKKINLK